MSNIVKLAATFRHRPEEDGNAIPASIERPDPTCSWETCVDPILGFMCISFNGKVSWSFIKYEAPDERFSRKAPTVPIRRMAQLATTRVGHVTCPSCGNSCIYPVWGAQDGVKCPACGRKGQEVSYIKETSDEFFGLLAELQAPLEDAVSRVNDDDPEFRFPNLYLLGHVEPSMDADPHLQGLAQAKGLALRLASETPPDGLFRFPGMQGEDTGLLLEPGIFTGTLDADVAREGWTLSSGVLTQRVKLPWLPKDPPRPKRFGGARI